MAGHDLALIKSQEKAEDDVVQSIEDLKKVTDDDPNCTFAIYIGITCGMSAPYVGSQIDWILNGQHPSRIKFMTVLMGFNTVDMGRKTPIEGFPKTMFQVMSELREKEGDGLHFIINPIVGPEPVAGSSRMKGGTVTKILLEMIAARTLHRAFPSELPLFPANNSLISTSSESNQISGLASTSSFMSLIDFFERVNRWTYLYEDKISSLVEMAGEALKSGGHVYYLGEDSVAMIALIDASECPPTYGADFSDVRGFVPGGWTTMCNLEGDMSSHGVNYQISDLDFEKNYLPSLSERDLVVFFHAKEQETSRLISLAKKCISQNASINIGFVSWSENLIPQQDILSAITNGSGSVSKKVCVVPIKLPSLELLPGLFSALEISAKWICNAISTGAHILKGKVWSNRMIDLNLSNDKLFRRGITLVSSLLSTSESTSTDAVLKSIHRTDTITKEIRELPISQHYQRACKEKKVIPIAILLASGSCATIAEAELALSKDVVLRNIIDGVVAQKN